MKKFMKYHWIDSKRAWYKGLALGYIKLSEKYIDGNVELWKNITKRAITNLDKWSKMQELLKKELEA